MLGQDMARVLDGAGYRVLALGRRDLDVTDAAAVRRELREHRPHHVVNCAAYTAVDQAESDQEAAYAVNAEGPRILAAECRSLSCGLVHMSTDYVFGGDSPTPYAEDEPTRPQNVYGRTKLAGERAVAEYSGGCVVRSSWLYGRGGPNFVSTMIRLESQQATVDVVDDQFGQPTWTMDVAGAVCRLLSGPRPSGVFHVSNSGETTWYRLAREVFTLLGTDPDRVRPIPTALLSRPAARPARSVLAAHRWSAAGHPPLRGWRDALHAAWPSLRPTTG